MKWLNLIRRRKYRRARVKRITRERARLHMECMDAMSECIREGRIAESASWLILAGRLRP